MGQQQLLLVILVTIIVGIATVVAINTFGSAADSANVDAVRQDLASIAAAAQGYYMRPEMLGGGGRSFANMDFSGIAVPGTLDDSDGGTNDVLENENGIYTITGQDATTLTVTGLPQSQVGGDEEIITARICADGLDLTQLGSSAFVTDNCATD